MEDTLKFVLDVLQAIWDFISEAIPHVVEQLGEPISDKLPSWLVSILPEGFTSLTLIQFIVPTGAFFVTFALVMPIVRGFHSLVK